MSTSNTTTGAAGKPRRRAAAEKPPATRDNKASRARSKSASGSDTAIAEAGMASWAAPAEQGEWQRRVAEAAYFRAERRGFVGGTPEQDWFEAEEELRRLGDSTF